jgi:hypothetical protein
MEYADTFIKEAERRQEERETPYDDQLFMAKLMQDKINMLLALMRAEISDYHAKYGDITTLSNQLQDAENGMNDALSDLMGCLQTKIETYDPKNRDEA